MERKRSRMLRSRYVVLIALIIGSVLVASQVTETLWFDELYTIEYYATLDEDAVGDVHPPLYPLLIAAWAQLFGTSVVAFRSFSIIFWLATAYVVSTRSRVGAVLILLSPAAIEGATDARMYALLGFAVSLIGVGLDTNRRRLLMIGTLIASFTHVYGVIISAAAYGALMLTQRRFEKRSLSWAAVVGAWYAFQSLFIESSRATWMEISIETIRALAAPFGASVALLSVLWIPYAWYAFKERNVVALTATGTIIAAGLITFTYLPILQPRYTIVLAPLIGLTIGSITRDTRRAAIVVGIILLLLTPLHASTHYHQDYEAIGTLPDEGDLVISYRAQQGYYTNGSIVCWDAACVRSRIEGYDTVWVIDGMHLMPDPFVEPFENWTETKHNVTNIDVRSYTR